MSVYIVYDHASQHYILLIIQDKIAKGGDRPGGGEHGYIIEWTSHRQALM